jgi:hypothetical protein
MVTFSTSTRAGRHPAVRGSSDYAIKRPALFKEVKLKRREVRAVLELSLLCTGLTLD